MDEIIYSKISEGFVDEIAIVKWKDHNRHCKSSFYVSQRYFVIVVNSPGMLYQYVSNKNETVELKERN